VKAVFVELPAFSRHLAEYLDDAGFAALQAFLLAAPEAGDVIYFWWSAGSQCWLFTLYGKNEASDLTADQRKTFKAMLKAELQKRKP
jgi:hypothetical protein